MTLLATILAILATVTGLEWLLRNALALSVWKRIFHLRPDSEFDIPPGPAPRVSVVVAAKDEEHNIESCVRSLLRQEYPNFEVIVVDDRSTDRTGEIVDAIAAEDDRLRRIRIEELPEGWCGKNHAMQRGIEQADGDWILMTDADCTQATEQTIRRAMGYAMQTQADMLSLLPELEMGGFWEKFYLPICVGVLMIWFRPSRVNDPRKPHAYANGMFMLIRRDAYDAVGRHEAIAGSLIEDMDLARRVKSAGLRLVVTPNEGLYSVRMYTNREQIIRGWVRIFVGSFRTVSRLTGALLVLFGRGLTPLATCLLGWLLVYLGGGETARVAAILGSVALAAQLVMTARYYHHTKSAWWMGLFYPIGCSAVGAILLKAIWTLRPGGTIVWRETSYDVSESAERQ
jgi:chlorobactene glucosyltransferase